MRSTSHWARTTYIEEGKKEISARHPYSRFTPSLLYPSLPFSLSLSPSPSLSHAHIRTSAGEAVEHSLRKPPLTKIWSDLVFLSTFLELFILKLKVKKLVETFIEKKWWCLSSTCEVLLKAARSKISLVHQECFCATSCSNLEEDRNCVTTLRYQSE